MQVAEDLDAPSKGGIGPNLVGRRAATTKAMHRRSRAGILCIAGQHTHIDKRQRLQPLSSAAISGCWLQLFEA